MKASEWTVRKGVVAHYVPAAAGGVWINAHTHGLDDACGHPDFQVVLPVSMGLCRDLFAELSALVAAGRRFEPGHRIRGVVKGLSVMVADAEEDGRHVLRVLLPDAEGRLPGDPAAPSIISGQAAVA